WRAGKLTQYAEMAGHRVGKLLEDHDGSVWVVRAVLDLASRTLCEIRNGRVQCHGDDGGPGAGVTGLYEDRRGTLWAGTPNGLWRWKPGAPKFYARPGPPNGFQGFSEDEDGALLISEMGGLRRFVEGTAAMAYPFPDSRRQFDF